MNPGGQIFASNFSTDICVNCAIDPNTWREMRRINSFCACPHKYSHSEYGQLQRVSLQARAMRHIVWMDAIKERMFVYIYIRYLRSTSITKFTPFIRMKDSLVISEFIHAYCIYIAQRNPYHLAVETGSLLCIRY